MWNVKNARVYCVNLNKQKQKTLSPFSQNWGKCRIRSSETLADSGLSSYACEGFRRSKTHRRKDLEVTQAEKSTSTKKLITEHTGLKRKGILCSTIWFQWMSVQCWRASQVERNHTLFNYLSILSMIGFLSIFNLTCISNRIHRYAAFLSYSPSSLRRLHQQHSTPDFRVRIKAQNKMTPIAKKTMLARNAQAVVYLFRTHATY